MSGLPMLVTLPAERRFRAIASSLAEKLAEATGVAAAEARALGGAFGARVDALCDAAAPGADLELAFDVHDGRFRARARCQGQGFEVVA